MIRILAVSVRREMSDGTERSLPDVVVAPERLLEESLPVEKHDFVVGRKANQAKRPKRE